MGAHAPTPSWPIAAPLQRCVGVGACGGAPPAAGERARGTYQSASQTDCPRGPVAAACPGRPEPRAGPQWSHRGGRLERGEETTAQIRHAFEDMPNAVVKKTICLNGESKWQFESQS